MKKLLMFFVCITASLLWLKAEVFQFLYEKGSLYRIVSQVSQSVFINQKFSHRAEFLNKIRVEILDANASAGRIKAQYQISERQIQGRGTYDLYSDKTVEFVRDNCGIYTVPAGSTVPSVRDIPFFPQRDFKIGDSWTAMGLEIQDLKDLCGIQEVLEMPVRVFYTYTGKADKNETYYDLIRMEYNLNYEPEPQTNWGNFYPVLVEGNYKEFLYWDQISGRPLFFNGTFDMRFTMNDGQVFRFVSTEDGKLVDSVSMDQEKLRKDIQKEIEKKGLKDIKIKTIQEGISLQWQVRFIADSDKLLSGEMEKVKAIAEILKQYPQQDLLVIGHTAKAGKEEIQQSLSEKRSRVIAELLINLGARTSDQIITKGMGSREPVAPNDTEANMQKNRRVEIQLLKN